ncbi:MAG: sugar phosphate nucleotidyltransferase [Patescibacteria group bacterium]|jgi:mannose-1-phosphate guanylyltransferase
MYIVIRAGGVGTRLWPVSRQAKPKQFHALTSRKTLLQEAVDRVADMVPVEHIFVSCNKAAELAVQQQLNINPQQIISEPVSRDTAAAIGLEAVLIAKQDPTAIVASLGSDHVINDTAEFQRVLKLAEITVQQQPKQIVCIGITPKQPDTGYGYIELGKPVAGEVFQVHSFKEKPSLEIATEFLKSGHYLWNANMFVWRVDTLLKLYQQFMPAMYQQLLEIQANPDKLPEIYARLEKVAVDYAIIERAPHILAMPGSFGWNDIGDWARLKDELAPSESDNYVNKPDNHVSIDDKNILIHSETNRVIATLGLKNIIIVDTPDALLVCKKNRSQGVKDLVEILKTRNRLDVL